MTFFVFFLQRSRALRDLPSFPTRRSSDLSGPNTHYFVIFLLSKGLTPLVLLLVLLALLALGESRTEDVAEAGTGIRRTELDRKSTRLNSSHMSISYAVFCLKKKKKQ